MARFVGVVLSAGLVVATSGCRHDSEQKFWTQYLKDCNPAVQIGKNAQFFGSTNNIGPGSVWGTASGATNLVATESSYLGAAVGGKYPSVNYATASGACSGTGTRTWDFSLGLPVTFGTDDAASLAAQLKNVKTIKLSVNSVEIDSIPTAAWEDAANKIDHSSAEFEDAADGKHYVMSAGMAVTGLTITYTLDSSISAELKGNIQAGKTVNVGTASNPVDAKVDVDTSGEVVTITATGRVYILGQLLKLEAINPTPPAAAVASQDKPVPQISVAADLQQRVIHVTSITPQ